MKKFAPFLLLLFVMSFPPLSQAACNVEAINRVVSKSLAHVVFDKAQASPIRGLCEALINTEVFYVSEKGEFLLVGNLVSVKSGENLTMSRRSAIVSGILAQQDEKRMLIMGPDKPRKTITVFTDVDCPYCAKLHNEVPALIKHGVKVRYLLFPRSGIGSPTYAKSVSVWCAEDRVAAIGIAKAGGQIPARTCDNPVADHFRLGTRLGVNGTPTLILEDGTRISGYLPAQRLLALLGLDKKPGESEALRSPD